MTQIRLVNTIHKSKMNPITTIMALPTPSLSRFEAVLDLIGFSFTTKFRIEVGDIYFDLEFRSIPISEMHFGPINPHHSPWSLLCPVMNFN